MLLRATRAQRNVLIQSSRRFASAAEETIERPDQPPPVELDESYQRLLDDVNLSIERYEKRNIGSAILQVNSVPIPRTKFYISFRMKPRPTWALQNL